jgi:hypothetical protein
VTDAAVAGVGLTDVIVGVVGAVWNVEDVTLLYMVVPSLKVISTRTYTGVPAYPVAETILQLDEFGVVNELPLVQLV